MSSSYKYFAPAGAKYDRIALLHFEVEFALDSEVRGVKNNPGALLHSYGPWVDRGSKRYLYTGRVINMVSYDEFLQHTLIGLTQLLASEQM
jgi:hypothetical protein